MTKSVLFFIGFLLLLAMVCHGDVITLKSGKKVECRVVGFQEGVFTLRLADEVLKKVYAQKIKSISFSKPSEPAREEEPNGPQKKIEEFVKKKYPDDYSTQKYVYEKQMSAYEYMLGVTDSEIKKIAERQYPDDYSTQKYVYDRQLSAKQYMEKAANSRIKSKAKQEYPNDYLMQKYIHDKDVSRD